ncbi:MAG: TlpA disulfide reductase family protein [Balneolaceae bacterium]
MKTIPLFFLLLFIGFACSESPRENPRELDKEEQKIDAAIYSTSFQDLEGNEVKVSDFEGKVILVDFWETWCGPCLQVFPAMDSLQNEYPDDFVVIAVNLNNSDELSDVQAFQNNNKYNFSYVLDTNKIADEIITLGIPFKVFLDPQGYLITTELGSAGTEGDYQKAKVIIEEHKKS